METAHRARGGRRQNLSLRHLAPLRGRRDREHAAAQTAFEAFYREHVAAVYQYALAVLANPSDAEDVTQQTFLNAYRAFQRGERPEKAHNWLIKIAHNVCRMRWRQSARRPQELPLETAREPMTMDEEKPALDEVLAALGRLPFNQRAALVMRELEDRSYADIAEVLGTSVSAVEALLFRARTNLRANRSAIGALSVVPVPASLGSFFGGGSSGLLAAGGVAVGTEVVLKAAAVVATGVVVGGLGYKSVSAVANAETGAPAVAAEVRQYQAPLGWASRPSRFLAAVGVPQGASGRAGGGAWALWPETVRAGAGPHDNDVRLGDEGAAVPGAAAAGAAAASPAAPSPGAPSAADPTQPVSDATTRVTSSVGLPPPPVPLPPAPAPLPPPPVPLPPPPVALPPPPPAPLPVEIPTVPTVPTVSVPTVPVPVTVPTVGLPPPPPILK